VIDLDALAAWDHHERTGLHITRVEADEWLTKLADGEDGELSLCHT
jgi:hypothetical protein